MATLTFAYADSTAVLGPLALRAEPSSYDLCEQHSTSLSVPRGWEVIRLPLDDTHQPHHDDLVALAEAVREAAGVDHEPAAQPPYVPIAHPPTVVEVGRRGHLTLLTDAT